LETMTKNNLYEGMFLVDSALAGSNWDSVINTIKTILERAEAQIVSIRKWDDRKLAYEIHGKGRGAYILCYFRVNGERIKEIEKAVQLSEQIMRVLILNAEHMTAEDIEKETPASKIEKEKGDEQAAQEEPSKQQKSDYEAKKAEESTMAEVTVQENITEQEPEELTENKQESEPSEVPNE
jgi:small subunit ribosomal protein S6